MRGRTHDRTMTAHAPRASAPVAPPVATAPALQRHTPLEDVVGLATGAILVSLALYLLHAGSLVTGGTAGLALLVGYATGIPYPVLFVLVNLPFLIAAVRRRGWSFTIRTLLTVGAVSALSGLYAMPRFLGEMTLDPVFAAVIANVLVGVGVVVIFRHRSSLGGFNIAALIVQDRTGFSAGWTLMILDGLVILGSFFVVEPLLVLASILGAVVLNGILVLNHKPGRYLGA